MLFRSGGGGGGGGGGDGGKGGGEEIRMGRVGRKERGQSR